MERVPLDRPVLVTGIPRAGKTTVRKALASAGEFASINEPLLTWNYGMRSRVDDRRLAEEATPAVREHIRADCDRTVRRMGGERYLDDLSYHTLRIPFVRAVMPEARIVLVVRSAEVAVPEFLFGWTNRDPVSKAITRRRKGIRLQTLPRAAMRFVQNYVGSRVRGRRASWGPTPPGFAEFAQGRDIAEVAAYQWRKLTEIALDDLERCPPECRLLVRHDKLLSEPRAELERIAAFCEVRDPEAVVAHGMDVLDPNYESFKRVEPSEEQWRLIREQTAALQRRLGFSDACEESGAEPQESASRHGL